MTPSVTDKTQQIINFFNQLPFNRFMGISLIELGDGRAEMSVNYNPNFVGDRHSKVIHGGVVTTLLDAACGAAVMSAGVPKVPTATIDLRIDYLRSARPGRTIFAKAHCFRITASVAFVRAEANDGSSDVNVALANGAFTSPI